MKKLFFPIILFYFLLHFSLSWFLQDALGKGAAFQGFSLKGSRLFLHNITTPFGKIEKISVQLFWDSKKKCCEKKITCYQISFSPGASLFASKKKQEFDLVDKSNRVFHAIIQRTHIELTCKNEKGWVTIDGFQEKNDGRITYTIECQDIPLAYAQAFLQESLSIKPSVVLTGKISGKLVIFPENNHLHIKNICAKLSSVEMVFAKPYSLWMDTLFFEKNDPVDISCESPKLPFFSHECWPVFVASGVKLLDRNHQKELFACEEIDGKKQEAHYEVKMSVGSSLPPIHLGISWDKQKLPQALIFVKNSYLHVQEKEPYIFSLSSQYLSYQELEPFLRKIPNHLFLCQEGIFAFEAMLSLDKNDGWSIGWKKLHGKNVSVAFLSPPLTLVLSEMETTGKIFLGKEKKFFFETFFDKGNISFLEKSIDLLPSHIHVKKGNVLDASLGFSYKNLFGEVHLSGPWEKILCDLKMKGKLSGLSFLSQEKTLPSEDFVLTSHGIIGKGALRKKSSKYRIQS